MNLLRDPSLQSFIITDFRGTNERLADFTGPPNEASFVENVIYEYVDKGLVAVATRPGFGLAYNPGLAIQSLYNWIQQLSVNRLIYFHSNAQVVSRDLNTSTNTTILTGLSAAGMIASPQGYRLYMAFYSAAGQGATEGRVWDGTFTSGTPNVSKLFQRPLLTTEISVTPSEPLAGSVTAGLHNIGLLVKAWSGADTRPSPTDAGLNLVPIAFTSSGSKNIQLLISPVGTWPLWAESIRPIMTTISNPLEYFIVPGDPTLIPRGTSSPVLIQIDIDDVTLSSGIEALPYFDLVSMNSANTGPWSPHFIGSYNDRAVYFARILAPDSITLTTGIFFSDRFNPQYLIPSTHQVYLPNFRDAIGGVTHGSSYVVWGPSWLYAFTDNNDSPVNWGPAREIDPTKGSPFVHGVVSDKESGVLWVADRTGLYAYEGGIVPILPANNNQLTTWSRINWKASQETFDMTVNTTYHIIIVKAPLDGASVATHLLVWDYQAGTSPDRIRFCGTWPITGQISYGGMATVYNPQSGQNETWISCAQASPGKIVRLKSLPFDSASLYNDDGLGYQSRYRSGRLVMMGPGHLKILAATLGLQGNMSVGLIAYSADQKRTRAMNPIAPTSLPGQLFTRAVKITSPSAHIEITNGAAVNSWWKLSSLRPWFHPFTINSRRA